MEILDSRTLAAAVAQPQPQWSPVLGFLLPLYLRLVVCEGVATSEEAAESSAADAWQQALAAFRQIGFDYVPILACKQIDNESANARALDRALDAAGKELR